jgi:hypothetical protein
MRPFALFLMAWLAVGSWACAEGYCAGLNQPPTPQTYSQTQQPPPNEIDLPPGDVPSREASDAAGKWVKAHQKQILFWVVVGVCCGLLCYI